MDFEKSLQVVNGLSEISIPPSILEKVNVEQLFREIGKSQQDVRNTRQQLSQARKEYEDGNFLGNWLKSRSDAVRGSNADLAVAIAELTDNSTKLLVFNTAISKVLLDQQQLLQLQQQALQHQAAAIEEQTSSIARHQQELEHANKELAQQQEALKEVNEGLLAAEGISLKHAKQLTLLVERAEMLEQNLRQETARVHNELLSETEEIYQQFVGEVAAFRAEEQSRRDEQTQRLKAESAELYEHVKSLSEQIEYRVNALGKQLRQDNEDEWARRKTVIDGSIESVSSQMQKHEQRTEQQQQEMANGLQNLTLQLKRCRLIGVGAVALSALSLGLVSYLLF